jgi:hypothetical protein
MEWQSFQNDMSLGHLFDPIFDNHYLMSHRQLTGIDGCYVTKLCNYVSNIIPSNMHTLCPTSINLITP